MTAPVIKLLIALCGWAMLLLATALCAALDAACSHARMRDLLEADGPVAGVWARQAATLRATAAALHVVALMATAAAIALCVVMARQVMSASAYTAIALAMAACTIVLGEFAPRYAGTWYSRGLVLRLLGVLRMLAAVLRWPIMVLLALARAGARIVGARTDICSPFAGDELDAEIAEAGGASEAIPEDQHAMIKSIFEFGDTIVREIMTPRTEMDAVPVTASVDDAIRVAITHGRSRIPVYERDADHVVGVFYVRDALAHLEDRENQPPPELKAIMRAPLFVPETKKVTDMLNELRRSKSQIAIVVDEYGGTSGLVTIEDLVEEIVGDIRDEYVTEQTSEMRQLNQTTFVVDASLSVFDINDSLNVNLPIQDDVDTLGGYIMVKLGRLPKDGEIIEEKDLTIKVRNVVDRRIEEVELTCRRHTDT